MYAETPEVSFDTVYEAYRPWIRWNDVELAAPRRGRGCPAKREKIVVAGDFHSPFHGKQALKALIREEAADTDLLVISGDLGDFWSTTKAVQSTAKDMSTIVNRFARPASWIKNAASTAASMIGKFLGF